MPVVSRELTPITVHRGSVPLYYQLEVLFREAIRSEQWPLGGQIPTEAELGRQYGVSRVTVRQAINNLVGEGLLKRRQGVGTFVAAELPSSLQTAVLAGDLLDLRAIAKKTEARLVARNFIVPNAHVMRLLQAPAGARCLQVERVRTLHGEPISFVTNVIPEPLASRLPETGFEHGSTMDLLEQFGRVSVAAADQVISATVANPRDAQLLGMRVGEPLLCVERVMLTEDMTPLAFVRSLYRVDRFQFSARLTRGSPA